MNKDRKIALASLGVAIVGVILYRRSKSSGSTTVVASSPQGSVQPYTPQQPLVLQPNESVYDPNSEGLLTAPTQGTTPSAPAYNIKVNYPKPTPVKRTGTGVAGAKKAKPTKRAVTHTNAHHRRSIQKTHHRMVTK